MRLAIVSFTLFIALVGIPRDSRSGAGPDLTVAEIMAGPARDWDGSGTFSARDDEWVEVHNASAAVLDLATYFLTDADSIPRYAFTGTLLPDARLVVYGRDAYNWERSAGFPAFGLSLANGGDAVLLWRVSGAETLLVDSYAYRSHEAAADRSVGRLGDLGEWTLFDGLNPYAGSIPPLGTGCEPSPGGPNLCQPTGTHTTTWGRLKSLYR